MPLAGFEPVIPETKRPKAYAIDHAITEIGSFPCGSNQALVFPLGFRNNNLLRGWIISPAPNPQPGGPLFHIYFNIIFHLSLYLPVGLFLSEISTLAVYTFLSAHTFYVID
jgi:hypothetical protein